MQYTQTIEINSSNQSLYTFDSDKINFTAAGALLKLLQDDIDFTEDFADDTDFTYDNTKAEFSGGLVRQKDQRNYSNASFEASYNSVINGTRGLGVLTGTSINGATITGAKLDLTGGKSVNYNADLNADSQQTLCIKFKATPNFTGAPPTDYPLITICKSNGNTDNIVMIRLQSNGQLQIFIQDLTGAVIINSLQGVWNNISGIRYEFGLNVDITNGATRLFVENKISGICEQFGSTLTGIGTRDDNITFLNVGGNYNNVQFWDGYIEDLVIFDSVQNTTDYTAGEYSVPDYLYTETSVILPEMQHISIGTIKLFNSLIVTYSGLPRILLEIGRSGNKLYWNGSSWVTSDLTYLQATDPTIFDTNCTSLNVDGEEYGQFTIVFPDSNTQSSVSELTANMNVDIGYDQNNPTIEDVTTYSMVELINFLEDVTKSGSDNIKTILKKDNQWYYNNAGTWTVTDGETYTESNSASEILTYASLFPGEEATVKIKRFLHSDDGQTTPQINSNTITYEGVAPIESSKVYNYLEGYGIDTSVITASWIVQRINYLIIPWIEKNTRLKLDAETETTEYLSGTGKEILMLSKKPVNELVSISYVRSTGTLIDLANMVELDQNEGQLIAKNNPIEGLFGVVFEKGNKNIKVTYKYGMDDFIDPITENTADDIKEAVIYMAAKQMLIQIGARTGGGSLTVQSHSRNYGPRGKFTDIINNLDMMAYEILKDYFTGVAGS